MPTTTERGLGWEHHKQRRRLLIHFVEGTECEHCGKPMSKDQPLQADHSIPRSLAGNVRAKANRLLHAWCNESRGNGTRVPTGETRMYETLTSREW